MARLLPLAFLLLALACDPKAEGEPPHSAPPDPGESGWVPQETGPDAETAEADSAPPDTASGDTSSPDTAGSLACEDLAPAPAGPATEAPTCTAVGEVSWDLRMEWEWTEWGEWDLAGVMLQAEEPQTLVLLALLNTRQTVRVEGMTGGYFDWWDTLYPQYNSASVLRSSPGGPWLHGYVVETEDALAVVDLSTEDYTELPLYQMDAGGTVVFRDLDRDSAPEVLSPSGAIRLDGTPVADYPNPLPSGHSAPLVADLDDDGLVEVVNRHGVWDALTGAGTAWPLPLWEGDERSYQMVALQAEGQVLLGLESWYGFLLTDTGGVPLWILPYEPPEPGFPREEATQGCSSLSAGDVDGDGAPEICLRTNRSLRILGMDGTVEWEWEKFDVGASGCTLADLDADGVYEIVDHGPDGLSLRSGITGELLAYDPTPTSAGCASAPTVQDLDGDGSAEILVRLRTDPAAEPTYRSYGPASGRWARTRRVWHQRSYDITSVSDEGVALTWPFSPWEAYNAWRAQPAHDGAHPDLVPTLTGACATACEAGVPTSPVTVAAQVSNLGSVEAPAGATLRLLTWDPADEIPALTELASATVSGPIPATSSAEGVLFSVPPEAWTGFLLLQVDGTHTDECDRVNDRLEVRFDPCAAP